MKILLRHVTIIDKGSSLHGKTQDVLIEDGIIKQISSEIACEDADEVLKNCYISVLYMTDENLENDKLNRIVDKVLNEFEGMLKQIFG